MLTSCLIFTCLFTLVGLIVTCEFFAILAFKKRIAKLEQSLFKLSTSEELTRTSLHNLSGVFFTTRQTMSNKIELLESEIQAIHNLIGLSPGQIQFVNAYGKDDPRSENGQTVEQPKRVRSRSAKRTNVPNKDIPAT